MNEENPLIFPKQHDRERLEKYKHFDQLYDGDHYKAFNIKTSGEFNDQYKKLRYIVANFASLISKIMADMQFGEAVIIDAKERANADYLNSLIHENDLMNQGYESAIINSRRGDDVFKIRIGKRNPLDPNAKPEIIIEQVGADIYFPQFDSKAARNVAVQDVIAVQFNQGGKTYLHKETHQPGKIYHEVFLYDPRTNKIVANEDPLQFGYLPEEDTKVNRSLVFHVPNFRDGKFFGPSDYKDLESMFFALNNRITKTDNILDKHSDPILAVPPGVIDEQGKVKKEALGMFEVDNENPGFNKPEYIVWNANLEAAFKEIDKLIDLLFMMSEIAPATMGADKNGQAESGRALKFKLLSTIRKRNRKMAFYDMVFKNMLTTAMELSLAWGIPTTDGLKPVSVEIPTIKWPDGVANDEVEMTDVEVKRVEGGLQTKKDAIARLDDITPEQAEEKVQEIEKENLPDLAPIQNNTTGNVPTQGNPTPVQDPKADPVPPAGS